MHIFSKHSGFKNVRDLILFVFGLGICIWHIATTPPAELSVPLLIFGGGIAASPTVLRQDERRNDDEK